MGLRELLILILILAIAMVVLRGLFVALRSRRGHIKIALDRNIPAYDLNEIEMRELPNGGARMVERSFAEVIRQNSVHAALANNNANANATAKGRPSTLHPRAKGLKTNLSRSPATAAASKTSAQADSRTDSRSQARPGTQSATRSEKDHEVRDEVRHEAQPDTQTAQQTADPDFEMAGFSATDFSEVATHVDALADDAAAEGALPDEAAFGDESADQDLSVYEQSLAETDSPVFDPLAHEKFKLDNYTETEATDAAEREASDFDTDNEPVFDLSPTQETDEPMASDDLMEPGTYDNDDEFTDEAELTPEPDFEAELEPGTEPEPGSEADSEADSEAEPPHASGKLSSDNDDSDELDGVLDDLLDTSPPAISPSTRAAMSWHSQADADEQTQADEELEEVINEVADEVKDKAIEPEPEYEPEPTYQTDDDMPDFDNEYEADPEPQPQDEDSFIAKRDDDFDVLFGDDDNEREREQRMTELEEQQDTTSRRFMSWAGGAFGRLKARRAQAAEESAARAEDAAKQKQLAKAAAADARRAADDERAAAAQKKAQPRAARDAADAPASQAADNNYVDDDYGDDDVLAVREQVRPGAAARAQSQMNLDMDDRDLDDQELDEQALEEESYGADELDEREAAGSSAESGRPAPYSEVLVLNVMARPGAMFDGEDLLPVLMAHGLKFGEMSIFHRHADQQGTKHGKKVGPVLFSVANALNPGTFDLNRISEFSTQGVCFFMTLPNVASNMLAFDQMLATARKVQSALDAELKDDNRSVMTAQTVEYYRQRVRDFELQQRKNASAR